MFDIKFEIYKPDWENVKAAQDLSNEENAEDLRATMTIKYRDITDVLVVYINDLFFRLREWVSSNSDRANNITTNFLYMDPVECSLQLSIKKINNEFRIDTPMCGWLVTTIDVNNLCNQIFTSINEMFDSLGEEGERYRQLLANS